MLAQEEGWRLGHSRCGTEQLLLGLIGEGGGIGSQELRKAGVKLAVARKVVEELIGRGPHYSRFSFLRRWKEMPFSDRAKQALELAWVEAQKFDHSYVGTEHLALALLLIDEGCAAHVLKVLGTNTSQLRSTITDRIEKSNAT